ncbi:hypothetical protein D3C73_900430 [compost metagenome]
MQIEHHDQHEREVKHLHLSPRTFTHVWDRLLSFNSHREAIVQFTGLQPTRQNVHVVRPDVSRDCVQVIREAFNEAGHLFSNQPVLRRQDVSQQLVQLLTLFDVIVRSVQVAEQVLDGFLFTELSIQERQS